MNRKFELTSFTPGYGIGGKTHYGSNVLGCSLLFVSVPEFQASALSVRGSLLPIGSLFSGSGLLGLATASSRTDAPLGAGGSGPDKKRIVEKLWREFFSDPSQWWDHRSEKGNAGYPDFKHKKTQAGLWLDGKLNPPWVDAELTALPPETLQQHTFSWNRRLAGYNEAKEYWKTVHLFREMQREGINPDKFTFVPILIACSSLGDLEEGRNIHLQIIQAGHELDVYVASCLVDMYAKCGRVMDAREVFDKMPTRTVVSWTSMILAYVQSSEGWRALDLYQLMKSDGVEPDSVTFVGLLNACASVGALEEGRCLHEQIIQRGFKSDICVGNSLIDMYAKCGSIADAWRVFNNMPSCDVVSWNAMIQGYAKYGEVHKASGLLALYHQMRGEGVEPTSFTFVGLLNACASVAALDKGRLVHEHIIERGLESDIYVGNSLIDMYSKCGSIDDGRRVFDKMAHPDLVAWNAMILGYVKQGEGHKALQLFRQMHKDGMEPDQITFLALLKACASVAALEEGRQFHKEILQRSLGADIYLSSCLIDMYSKCGSIEDAQRVFNATCTQNVIFWNAMLAGYAIHGCSTAALDHFELMCKVVQVDAVTFLSLLSACSRGGLVDKGLHYFESMSVVYNVSPTMDHYACVVDLLGRAGCLLEAEDVMRQMPCEPDASVCRSLLGACINHGNLEVGQRVAKILLELDPESAVGYLLLSRLYAAGGKWGGSASIQQQRLQRAMTK